ncbi:Zn-dependent exopeptidase [Rhizoclosmatium globosum]|uniref:Peptide hydrolase n=1 Tax=Rhizoclosmatium globosum TaxID=329046 RepID=A0A1Y2CB79_9FUNG|nr:Zn-dependent exopeptidase [Rhizoclosmatium globosum]|eukprot:ORY44311.1 Zn-dependent exopeptidase [Rhizoclosmatium globosum]
MADMDSDEDAPSKTVLHPPPPPPLLPNQTNQMSAIERIRVMAVLFFLVRLVATFVGFQVAVPDPTALSFAEAVATNDFPGFDAFKQLEKIAQKPRPFNSPENNKVHSYIFDTLNAYSKASNATVKVLEYGPAMESLVYIPGVTNASVMLSAHFDSASSSPGASSNGAATAVMLQLARVLSMDPTQSQNSILLYFRNGGNNTQTVGVGNADDMFDGGVSQFMKNPEWFPFVENIKVAINLEGVGVGGKPIMLRSTSDKLSSVYSSLRYPHMNSFGARFIRRSDAVSDYDTYKASGIPAIDISFYENRRFYQTPDDSLDRIQPKHIQYLGSNALGLVTKLKDADWINSLEINAYPSPFYDHFGAFSIHEEIQGWTAAPLAVLGSAFAAYWISTMQTDYSALINRYAVWGAALNSVVAITFIAFNLPMMHIVCFTAIARIVSSLTPLLRHTSYLPEHLSKYLTETRTEFAICAAIGTVAVYPTVLLLDTLMMLSKAAVGTESLIVVPILVAPLTSILVPSFQYYKFDMELTPVPKSLRPVAITSLERIRLISILAYVVVITILFLIFRGVAPSPTALSFDQAIASNDFPALDAYAQLEQIAIKPHPSHN